MTSAAPQLRCLPSQRLIATGLPREADAAWAAGDSHGILALALGDAIEEAGLLWARDWGRAFLARLCQTREFASASIVLPELSAAHLAQLPNILGAEYVSAELLHRLWAEMLTHVETSAQGDLESWLRNRSGSWASVGRVTLRLAENKNDAVRPFAFLATYTEQISTGGKLQHLPLARALQSYVGKKEEAILATIMAPLRVATARSPLIKRLMENRQLFQALAWTPSEAYELIRDLPTLQDSGLIVKVPDWWKGGRPAKATVQVTLEAAQTSRVGTSAMLGFNIAVCMNGEPLSHEELEKIKTSASGLITLRGQWVEIDNQKLDQVLAHWRRIQELNADGCISFHQGMRFLSGFGDKGAINDQAEFQDRNGGQWSEIVADKNLQQVLNRLREPEALNPPAGLQATLRPYQLRGLGWLWFLQQLGLGACLADDMGLGKTLQVIALLLLMKERAIPGSTLIICPASLVGNWHAECRKFAPSLRVRVLHSSMTSQSELSAFELDADPWLADADVIITTYLVATRSAGMRKASWRLIVLDEAQAIKNPGTAQTQSVKKLTAASRIALTGTPVENRPGDLWSLFDFLNPGLLGGAAAFAAKLKSLSTERGTDYGPIRRLVAPYILRRMKTDKTVISDLPDKTEVKARCALTRKQATIYTRLVEELKKTLADKSIEPMQRRGLVLGFLMKFKQVCNHPSHYSGDGQFKVADSGKFLRLAEIGAELAERQQRVLVFTQFQEMCEPLFAHLTSIFGQPGLMLHGGIPVKNRPALVERFQAPDGPPFFVISVKAGGTGLTLTAASHVIHFDRWWNPAVENQATDRAFRIGQKNNVLVHKFIVPGTIEQKVDRMLEEKKHLSHSLLESDPQAEVPLTELSDDELIQLVSLDLESS